MFLSLDINKTISFRDHQCYALLGGAACILKLAVFKLKLYMYKIVHL